MAGCALLWSQGVEERIRVSDNVCQKKISAALAGERPLGQTAALGYGERVMVEARALAAVEVQWSDVATAISSITGSWPKHFLPVCHTMCEVHNEESGSTTPQRNSKMRARM